MLLRLNLTSSDMPGRSLCGDFLRVSAYAPCLPLPAVFVSQMSTTVTEFRRRFTCPTRSAGFVFAVPFAHMQWERVKGKICLGMSPFCCEVPVSRGRAVWFVALGVAIRRTHKRGLVCLQQPPFQRRFSHVGRRPLTLRRRNKTIPPRTPSR